MIIYPSASFAFLFFRIAQAGKISVIIVAPYECNIVRYFQPGIIGIQNLFIRDENLGNFFRILLPM